MTIAEMIYDIREIINALEDDSDISDQWLLYKSDSYRETVIIQKYEMNPVIDPSWQLPVPVLTTDNVKSSDDPSIVYGSVDLSKVTIPEPISLPDDMGIKVMASSGIVPYQYQSLSMIAQKAMIKEDTFPGMGYYARVSDSLYLYPRTMEVKLIIIPRVVADVKVLENGVYRDRTINDNYPADHDTAQRIILSILEKDLGIKMKTITDLVNDSQDQFKVLNDAIRRQD